MKLDKRLGEARPAFPQRDEGASGMRGSSPDDATLVSIEEAAVAMTEEAAGLVMARFGRPFRVDYKDEDRTDPVTDVDRAVEAWLTASIRELFPGHGLLGEEGQEPSGEPEYVWVLDPIDGTHNFVAGLPLFAVSVGVLHRRRPVAGVVALPATGEVLNARCGGGAFRHGTPLCASANGGLRRGLLAALPGELQSGFEVDPGLRDGLGSARHLGSTTYEMALVAAGVLDLAIFERTAVWDVAAGACRIWATCSGRPWPRGRWRASPSS
jgi:myo-inositol-1(or 4)-monophosphatase